MACIEKFSIKAYTIPTETPESDGTFSWNSTSMVLIHLWADDELGMGYTYAHPSVASFALDLIQKFVMDREIIHHPQIWWDMVHYARNNGESGMTANAISAIDLALWDLRGKLMKCSVSRLLGTLRDSIEVYGSGGFTNYSNEQLRSQFLEWQKQGIRKFKMKVGSDPDRDPARVEFARQQIGTEADLFVDGNGAYDVQTALKLATRFAEQEVSWFEQPILPSNIDQMRFLRSRLPLGMKLATGEYIYDLSELVERIEGQAEDVIQLDITRCKGLTGFLKCASTCEVWNIPISSHCAPALHAVIGCSIPNLQHLEYFYDHVRIETLFFDGIPRLENGYLRPNPHQFGFGFRFREEAAARYQL